MGDGKELDVLRDQAMQKGVKHPRKRLYRARAHSNPLNDAHFPVPAHPDAFDWGGLYLEVYRRHETEATARAESEGVAGTSRHDRPLVRFADVGCGFGGLLVRLAPLFPGTLMLGLELRDKVTRYVQERIGALRREQPGRYDHIAVLRTNAQKFLPNFFRKGQLTKLFLLFPDPHFKAQNHRRRIVSRTLAAEYAFCLAPGGLLYTITDVQELAVWMQGRLDAHALFERVPESELKSDVAAGLLTGASEEAQKVVRNAGQMWRAVYRRVASRA